ncbi:hypothetical protein N9M66_00405 [Litoreibacter sp.]|nr:hypothetical protein [Litoreibacter sp.]
MTMKTRVSKLENEEQKGLVTAFPSVRYDTHDGRIGDDSTQVRIRWAACNKGEEDWQTFYREKSETAEEFGARAFEVSKQLVRQLYKGRNIMFFPEFSEYV